MLSLFRRIGLLIVVLAIGWLTVTATVEGWTVMGRLRHWRRFEAKVFGVADPMRVTVQRMVNGEEQRIDVPRSADASYDLLETVTVLEDPDHRGEYRLTGWTDLWRGVLWRLESIVLLTILALAVYWARWDENLEWRGSWQPAPGLEDQAIATEYTIREQSTAWKANLFWSLLGWSMFAIALFERDANELGRILMAFAGGVWGLGLTVYAWYNATRIVIATPSYLISRSALGMRAIRWDSIGTATLEDVSENLRRLEGRSRRQFNTMPKVKVYSVADRFGTEVMRLDQEMVPAEGLAAILERIQRFGTQNIARV